MVNPIAEKDVIGRYEVQEEIWPERDKWHHYTHMQMRKKISDWAQKIDLNRALVLNVGSAGYNYGLDELDMLHIDLCIRNLTPGKSVVCNAEKQPFKKNYFDLIICVGSVLNYCDAISLISELNRVTATGGKIFLEFEKSDSLEFIFSKKFRASATTIDTFYDGKSEKIWVYSEKYIKSILNESGFNIIERHPIHVISPIFLKFFSSNFSAKFSALDSIAKNIPWAKNFSTNVIFQCEKFR